MSKKQSLLFGVVLVVLALVWSLLQRPASTRLVAQSPAPEFQLSSLEKGKTIRLSDHSGKVRLLVFWATWCPPCVAEIPTLKSLQEEFGGKGFQIIAISLDETVDPVIQMSQQMAINYPIALGTQETVEAYGNFPGVPTSFLVNKKGDLVTVIPGMVEEAEMKTLIESALFN